MPQLSVERRRALARQIRQDRERMADSVTRDFFDRHPDWLTRYGEAGWRRGIEDARFHVDFLASAVETGSAALYEDYGRWTARVLSARGIAPSFLIENLRQVEAAVTARVPQKEEQSYVAALFARACAAAASVVDSEIFDLSTDLSADRSLFLRAVLDGDRGVALTVLREALRRKTTVCDVYSGIIEAAMREIGRLWEANEITVAQEHVASAIVQTVLVQIQGDLPLPRKSRGRMLITGVEGELHQIGALMTADVIESTGWTVRYLGSNLPARAIIEEIRRFQPSVIGISVTMPFNVTAGRELIENLRATLGDQCPRIVVGGRAFRSVADAAAAVGADQYIVDLRAALDLFSPEAAGA